jgi:hypothetical protein
MIGPRKASIFAVPASKLATRYPNLMTQSPRVMHSQPHSGNVCAKRKRSAGSLLDRSHSELIQIKTSPRVTLVTSNRSAVSVKIRIRARLSGVPNRPPRRDPALAAAYGDSDSPLRSRERCCRRTYFLCDLLDLRQAQPAPVRPICAIIR